MQIERTITVTHRYKISASSEYGAQQAELIAKAPSLYATRFDGPISDYSVVLVDPEEEDTAQPVPEPPSQEDPLTKGAKKWEESLKKQAQEEAAAHVEPFDGLLLSAGNDVLRSRIIMKRVQDAIDEQWVIVSGNVPIGFSDLAVAEGDVHPRHATRSEVGHIAAMFQDVVFFRKK